MRAVVEVADLIDVVVEVRDARLPRATAVAGLHPRLRSKTTITLLNRADLANAAATKAWLEHLKSEGRSAFATIGTRSGTLAGLRAALAAHPRKRGVLRVAIVGAPNTGKSSVVNALGRRKRVTVADRAGVTRHVRWLKAAPGIEVLDTPGLLAPRIPDERTAWQLALCGSLPETAFGVEDTVAHFHRWLAAHHPELATRADLDAFAAARGMRRGGGELDRLNAARKLVSLFRDGELFRVTFEMPDMRA